LKIATAYSLLSNTTAAAAEALAGLKQQLVSDPELIICYYTQRHAPEQIGCLLQDTYPRATLQGCSTCTGVMTSNGFHSGGDGTALGLWALSDPDGGYGSAVVEIAGKPRAAGRAAVEQAILETGRVGELPELVWLSATPGFEEEVIAGIQEVLGNEVPIAGGSAADHSVSGHWSIFNHNAQSQDGVGLTLFYPSGEISFALHSGYFPSEISGTVTRAEGRTIYEIDDQSAVEWYNREIGGKLDGVISRGGGSILADTTLHPFGREVHSRAYTDFYKLSHPESITEKGAIHFFTTFSEGETVVLMRGSNESLINRAGRVAMEAMKIGDLDPENISGALAIYCAGCMLAVHDHMDGVVESINTALQGKPFLGAFTFGEQGCYYDVSCTHGNLMISTVVFGS